MATFSKQTFSANAGGSGILVAATATTGTLIHTVPSSVTDEVWIYGTNNDTGAVNLTLEFGDNVAKNNINLSVPTKNGLTIIVPGLILTGSSTVRAFAGTTNMITVHGYINRIT